MRPRPSAAPARMPLQRLARERENLRVALAWYRDQPGAAGEFPRLAAALWQFWEIRGDIAEGRAWAEPGAGPRA